MSYRRVPFTKLIFNFGWMLLQTLLVYNIVCLVWLIHCCKCLFHLSICQPLKCLILFYPQTDLEEERIKQKIADRTRKERCRIYLIRLILNLFVIGVLMGCFYSIYLATIFSQEVQMDTKKVTESDHHFKHLLTNCFLFSPCYLKHFVKAKLLLSNLQEKSWWHLNKIFDLTSFFGLGCRIISSWISSMSISPQLSSPWLTSSPPSSSRL